MSFVLPRALHGLFFASSSGHDLAGGGSLPDQATKTAVAILASAILCVLGASAVKLALRLSPLGSPPAESELGQRASIRVGTALR